ncbi:MAG: hypothetical protein BroJett040_04150 [Oligoflexia bacterium]|nr:MAG: hypothetical protein BroJett040_04150 [Oligoflexia bacterium]
MIIEYSIRFQSGDRLLFSVDLDKPTQADPAKPREWTALEFNQCPNCPLKKEDHPNCPAALEVASTIETFQAKLSHERVVVTVKSPERLYQKEVDMQTALRSLIGLMMAKSGCPYTSQLKSLAYFHLPFATNEETLFRTVSAYLLKQFFNHKSGKPADLDLKNLHKLYDDLMIVNENFLTRIRKASQKDANLNALVDLHSISTIVNMSLDEQLESLKVYFPDMK